MGHCLAHRYLDRSLFRLMRNAITQEWHGFHIFPHELLVKHVCVLFLTPPIRGQVDEDPTWRLLTVFLHRDFLVLDPFHLINASYYIYAVYVGER